VARGYLILRGMHLTRDQRAIVLAASKKSYAEEDITTALRTTYPMTITEKYAMVSEPSALAVVDENDFLDESDDGEIDALVATNSEDASVLEESEVIDTFATWKQARGAISKERLARGFGPPRPDVNKLRKRVRCFNCKEVGHFSKDCPKKKTFPEGGARPPWKKMAPASAKFVFMVMNDEGDQEIEEILQNYVDNEVNDILADWTGEDIEVLVTKTGSDPLTELIKKARAQRLRLEDEEDDDEECHDVHFRCVHGPGQAVIDTGCGKGLIGANRLTNLGSELLKMGEAIVYLVDHSPMKFRYGNGQCDTSTATVEVPWVIGQRRAVLQVHVVPGDVPFLISKPMLKALGAIIDTTNNTLKLSKINETVKMEESENGHYQVDIVLQTVASKSKSEVNIMLTKGEDFRVGRVEAQRPAKMLKSPVN
jgi:hypothetical protein